MEPEPQKTNSSENIPPMARSDMLNGDTPIADTPVLLGEYLKDKATLDQTLEQMHREMRGMYTSELILSFCMAGLIVLIMNEHRTISKLAGEAVSDVAET